MRGTWSTLVAMPSCLPIIVPNLYPLLSVVYRCSTSSTSSTTLRIEGLFISASQMGIIMVSYYGFNLHH